MNAVRKSLRAARYAQLLAAARRFFAVGTRYYHTHGMGYTTRESRRPQRLTYVHIKHPVTGQLVDVTLVLRFLLTGGAQGEAYGVGQEPYCTALAPCWYSTIYNLAHSLHPGAHLSHQHWFDYRPLDNLDQRDKENLAHLLNPLGRISTPGTSQVQGRPNFPRLTLKEMEEFSQLA